MCVLLLVLLLQWRGPAWLSEWVPRKEDVPDMILRDPNDGIVVELKGGCSPARACRSSAAAACACYDDAHPTMHHM